MNGYHLYLQRERIKTWKVLLGKEVWDESFGTRESELNDKTIKLDEAFNELIEDAIRLYRERNAK